MEKKVTIRDIDDSQQRAARIAGFLYLITMAISVFAHYFVRGRLIVRGDALQTARNISSAERLFRVGVACDLVMIAGVVMLVWALYVVLKPVQRNVALLAMLWRLVAECSLVAVTTVSSFAVLALLGGADYLRALDPRQLPALAYALLRVHGAGFDIAFIFLGLGSALFSYLWFKSRYIPRWLAALGVFSSSAMFVVTLALLLFPGLESALSMVYMAPMGFYEVALGFWLLIRGIRAPKTTT